MKYNYIAIEGNIGVGKTTLANKLAQNINARLILERFEDNSFLPRFYEDPKNYAFPLEMSFLADRYQQVKDQLAHGDLFSSNIVADYIIDKSRIFASINLPKDELLLFNKLCDIIYPTILKPDLIVYLHLSVDDLIEKIRERGRSYELNIKASYLEKIQNRYFDYFRKSSNLRIVIADITNKDLLNNENDFQIFLEMIAKEYPKKLIIARL
ncbi:MAG: deoxynucleoside kinase [Bacteroidetes bacterium]|nr:deoxynucleoside kinase [Bacteroidota bacterium]